LRASFIFDLLITDPALQKNNVTEIKNVNILLGIFYIQYIYIDNNSDVNESQSIDINSINLNNHTFNDCESPSDSDNIATRVKAKYSKARQKKIHKKSQKSNTRRRNNIYNQTCKKRKTQSRNLNILSPSESLSIEY
jgi:hypothetical protein